MHHSGQDRLSTLPTPILFPKNDNTFKPPSVFFLRLHFIERAAIETGSPALPRHKTPNHPQNTKQLCPKLHGRNDVVCSDTLSPKPSQEIERRVRMLLPKV